MKKILGIIVLGLLLTSCSEYMSRQKIENCADTKYSKEMARPMHVYFYVTQEGHSGTEFELNLFIMRDSKVPIDMISDEITNLLSEKDISEFTKKWSEGAIDTFKRYNYKIKKFINLSVDKKVNNKYDLIGFVSYRHFFETCELEQKEAPNTFNALWKKADIKYIDLSNLIKKLKK